MRLLALDIAGKTGWAVVVDGARTRSGVYKIAGRDLPERCGAWRRWLMATLQTEGITHVAHEDAHVRFVGVAAALYSYRAVMWIVAREMFQLPCVGVSAAELKQHATGRGNAPKTAMIEAARARWGHEPVDDNEADALCVAAWALESVEWGD